MGGGAVLRAAAEVRSKFTTIAEAIGLTVPLEGPIDEEDIDRVAAVAWWHQHLIPAGLDPGLSASAVYTPGMTNPESDGRTNHDETYGSHASAIAVEVDPATGSVQILSALLVSDCGVIINPMVVEGQHQGAFAQGIGVALLEEVRYSAEGQPQCATLLDYTIPTALDVPGLKIIHRPTPSEMVGGFRGMGEAAIIATPALLVSAVEDALSTLGIRLSSTRVHAREVRNVVRASGWRPRPADWARQ
jgi:CO/xanthine dehydrogenase Mo-binding subunit